MAECALAIPVPSRVLLAAALLLVPVQPGADTLQQALVGAYESNGLLEQNRALLRAADEDAAQTLGALRPKVDWTSDVKRTVGDTRSPQTGNRFTAIDRNEASIGLNAELLLFDGGRSSALRQAALQDALAAGEGLRRVEQEVLTDAVRAFMNLWRQSENLLLRQNNLRLLQEEARAARDRFEVGEVTRTDVALAESRLAGARSALVAAEGAVVEAKAEYVSATGRTPGKLVPPSGFPEIPSDLDTALHKAMQRHPALLRAQYDVASAESAIARARMAAAPSLRLGGGVSVSRRWPTENMTKSANIGLSLSGPIYRGGSNAALTREAIARRDAELGALHETTENVRQNVKRAFSQVRTARASRAASDEQIRAAELAFQGVREEARLGARTTLDVLDAEQELLDARNNRIAADANGYIAVYSLLAAMGSLDAATLGLPVEIKGAQAR